MGGGGGDGGRGVRVRHVASQIFLVSPDSHVVCPVPSFSKMNKKK